MAPGLNGAAFRGSDGKEDSLDDSARTVPVNRTCPDLIPGQVFNVLEANFDNYAIRVEYRITPGIDDLRKRTRGQPPIIWQWSATDDLGNEYEQCGGAYGPSRDGQSTEGVLSLRPLPPRDAKWLRVSVNPFFLPELNMKESACVVHIDLGTAQGVAG